MTSENSEIERIEALTLRRQQIAFCILTLFTLAALLLMHTLFSGRIGAPSKTVILVLCGGFSLKVGEVLWLSGKHEGIPERTAKIESATSIVLLIALAGVLALLTDRDETPYFVLPAIAILQAAYHFGLTVTISSIVISVAMMFAWIQYYFSLHPPARSTEYLESGMISVIYGLMGPVVWFLVNQLKQKQTILYNQMAELQAAREKLTAEERLAAIGRFASGIAHEIRNPVAMIASALATATYPAAKQSEREEMFAIAMHEAKRLEKLTGDFLSYARPSQPHRAMASITDVISHVADVTRLRAEDRSISVDSRIAETYRSEFDASQVEGALLNLTLNAIDATPGKGLVELRCRLTDNMIRIEVENSGKKIRDEDLERIFEPFFSTKATGTGLGLAIARRIAKAHGGDIWVSTNHDGAVVFSMTLAMCQSDSDQTEDRDG